MLKLLLWWFWPIRWGRASLWAVRGVRIAPSVLLLGRVGAYALGSGTKIGARTRLIAGCTGRILIGNKVWMSSDVELETDAEIRVGTSTSIQKRCTINGSVKIGEGCILAPNVFISSGMHPFRHVPHLPIREQEALLARDPMQAKKYDRSVCIEDDCWLGVNAVVCPGVTIGKGSVVGANAVVTHDVPPYTVVAGVPARVISKRV